MNISKYYKMDPTDSTSVRLERFPSNAVALKTDADGNISDAGQDVYKVKINATDDNPDFLEAKISDVNDIQFKANSDNDKIDSVVYQLTGLGAMLNSVKGVGFDFEQGPFPPPSSGGRGIAFGRRYINGVEVDAWVAQGNNGKLYWTDNRDATRWKNIIEDDSLYTTYPSARSTYGWSCIQFVYVGGTHNCYCWLMGSGDTARTFYYVEHKAENYNANGTFKTTAISTATYADGLGPYSVIDIMQVDATGGILWAGDDTRIGYTTDLATFQVALTADHNIGGMGFDGDNTVRVIERDYGVIWKSTSYGNPGTFSKVTSMYVDDVETSHFPVPNSAQWGSMFSMYGQWLSINFHYVSGGIGFIWSDDGEYWYTSNDEATQFYDANNDGLRWFATNAKYASGIPIYQLIVSVIPAHRRMCLEKGAVIDGTTILRNLPDAQLLGTDSKGRIVEKTVDLTSRGKYVPTMDVASAISVMIPGLVGARNEICVGFIPRVDTKISDITMFSCAISQGGTGSIILTLRDSLYRKIAASDPIVDPTGNTLLASQLDELEDPITHATITEYDLISGQIYYLGINYSINGAAYLGAVATQNMATSPFSSQKFDNLNSAPDTLGGGSETLLRPYIAITSE